MLLPLTIRSCVRQWLGHYANLKKVLIYGSRLAGLLRFTAAGTLPALIRPTNGCMQLALTGYCNLRCMGCRYGRDFMPGFQLPLNKILELLDDATKCGVHTVRLYGGEPLLHKDLPAIIKRALKNNLKTYVTTNGTLLRQKMDSLWDAGLRTITIGYYGAHERYDSYVQRMGAFEKLVGGLEYIRKRYGDKLEVQLNFLLMRPTCTLEAVSQAWELSERFQTDFRVDLIHYSLPYFSEGCERELQFRAEDKSAILCVVAEFLRLRDQAPERFKESPLSIRAIPDWLLRGPEMKVPCDASDMLWVGADGTVQMCYVAFRLGNLYETPLRDLLKTSAHRKAAYDSFRLNCPNCHCGRESRISKNLASIRAYR